MVIDNFLELVPSVHVDVPRVLGLHLRDTLHLTFYFITSPSSILLNIKTLILLLLLPTITHIQFLFRWLTSSLNDFSPLRSYYYWLGFSWKLYHAHITWSVILTCINLLLPLVLVNLYILNPAKRPHLQVLLLLKSSKSQYHWSRCRTHTGLITHLEWLTLGLFILSDPLLVSCSSSDVSTHIMDWVVTYMAARHNFHLLLKVWRGLVKTFQLRVPWETNWFIFVLIDLASICLKCI